MTISEFLRLDETRQTAALYADNEPVLLAATNSVLDRAPMAAKNAVVAAVGTSKPSGPVLNSMSAARHLQTRQGHRAVETSIWAGLGAQSAASLTGFLDCLCASGFGLDVASPCTAHDMSDVPRRASKLRKASGTRRNH